MSRSMPSRIACVSLLAVLLFSACSSEDPVVARARTVFDRACQENAEQATYGLSIAVASGTPFGHRTAVDAVASVNYETALEALRALAEEPRSEDLATLQDAFANKKAAAHKLQAAIGLCRLADESACGWLLEQIQGGAASAPAMVALADHGQEEEVAAVLRARMESDEPSVRNEAYVVLGELHRPWATQMLLQGLEKEFGEERVQAIASLGRTGDPAVAEKIQRFVTFQGLVFASIEALGALGNSKSIPVIEAMAQHEQELVRVYAAVALWRLGDESRGVEMVDTLKDSEDASVRENLAVQLGAVDSPGAVERLSTLAQDGEEAVRLEALRSLGSRPEATPDLFLSSLEDPSYQVATVALDALARVGSEGELATLEPLLENPNPYVALSAANAILSIKERGRSTS